MLGGALAERKAMDWFTALIRPVGEGGLLPHALCLSADPVLMWLHLLSDSTIALAYFSIPLALLYFAWRRRDLTHRWVLLLFGAFITACGSTHLMHIWTLFEPNYWLEGAVKAATAAVSLATAVLLWPLIPRLLALPSPRQLEAEVIERRAAEAQVRAINGSLEQRVRERTAELEGAKRQAERANAAKSQFLAAASHDLRQPVQALVYFAAALTSRIRDEGAQRLLADLHRSVAAIGMLLDALLDISKLDAGIVKPQPEDVPVNELLSRMGAEFAPRAAANGVRLRVVPCGARVRTDPLLLARIVQNLVANAVRYTPNGRILVGCRRQGDSLRICVIDTGIGIPFDRLDDIFEEFTQLGNEERDREKGLGLGLAIVNRLALLLGHRVAVHSQPGHGSTFSVQLPLAAALP